MGWLRFGLATLIVELFLMLAPAGAYAAGPLAGIGIHSPVLTVDVNVCGVNVGVLGVGPLAQDDLDSACSIDEQEQVG